MASCLYELLLSSELSECVCAVCDCDQADLNTLNLETLDLKSESAEN